MKLQDIPTPRLLPSTMAFMAVLLVVKSGILIHAAVFDGLKSDPTMVTPAQAASEPGRGKPVAGGAPPSIPAPSKTNAAADATKPVGTVKSDVGKQPDATRPAESEAQAISASEKALLQDLRQRRKELDAQADALKARETVLAAAEQKLSARVVELQALQKKLEALDAARKQNEEAGWQGLAKLYEAMKPRDAATIFNDLTMPVLLQVLDRMKDAKAAAVMAAMNPDKARDVTAELARLRLGHDPATGPDGIAQPPASTPLGG
jgi:flagellar motility protein MotE (MotC chaperone)